jgi:glucosamine--fructose-6-phosphate aminotransferase (isomerizing)
MEKKLQFSDSRLLFDALNKEQGDIFNKVKGETSFVFLDRKTNKLLYGTNTGSLYYNNEDFLIIASEKRLTKEYNLNKVELRKVQENLQMNSFVYLKSDWRKSLKRCTKCLLPESHPFIDFDKNGVCNYCRNYKVQKYIGRDKLLRKLDSIRSTNGEVDCIVGLSGGRDSCYGLHVLKKDFGMNPIAYTYDWGLTTQASRRNQSIICSELGVEHIIRSANLERKRKYINQNIKAWLKKPKLGMIPLFMAGDKEFYEYGRNLRKELGVETTILCSGQQIEQREFMVGFTGIKQPTLHNNPDMYHHPTIVKIKLATWYGLQYILNPSYFNSSFIDSLRAYFISFFKQSSEFIFLYRYLPWDETKINNTLKSYGWENDEAYGDNQWRMGDGQTAFNNFIYYHLAGLTEFDSYRSHQIRQGLISRDEALKKLKDENEPRLESIKEFFDVVGLPFEETLKKIKRIKPISF